MKETLLIKLSNKEYDFAKKTLTIYVPAFCVLLLTMTNLWNWNIPIESIIGSIEAISAFLGVLLGISSEDYHEKKNKKDSPTTSEVE